VRAGPAQVGLDATVTNPRVIQGASTTIEATVSNLASPGNDALNYSVQFTYPYGTSAIFTGTQPASNGATGDVITGTYNSTGQPLGANTVSVTATDPNAIGSPLKVDKTVTVLSPAKPFLWWAWQAISQLHPLGGAQEPSVDPLAFGATGGGESFSAVSLAIANDPPVPTAHLDLDSISQSGSPQITTDLLPFKNLPYNDDPQFGHPFSVFIDTSAPGSFSKTFTLRFSDEDIPGAREADSIVTSFTIQATVTPEPGTMTMLAMTFSSALLARRGRRN
jgi:hypothetical protein